MKFLWPHLLWLLALVPVLIAAYLYVLRRRKKAVVRYASLAMIRDALGPAQTLRRHVPPLLFLLALIAMTSDNRWPSTIFGMALRFTNDGGRMRQRTGLAVPSLTM